MARGRTSTAQQRAAISPYIPGRVPPPPPDLTDEERATWGGHRLFCAIRLAAARMLAAFEGAMPPYPPRRRSQRGDRGATSAGRFGRPAAAGSAAANRARAS